MATEKMRKPRHKTCLTYSEVLVAFNASYNARPRTKARRDAEENLRLILKKVHNCSRTGECKRVLNRVIDHLNQVRPLKTSLKTS